MHGDWQGCYPKQDLRTDHGRWRNTHTDSTPAVYHFNGGGKKFMSYIEEKLWYRQPSMRQRAVKELREAKIKIIAQEKRYSLGVEDMCPGYIEARKRGMTGTKFRAQVAATQVATPLSAKQCFVLLHKHDVQA